VVKAIREKRTRHFMAPHKRPIPRQPFPGIPAN
jgi:hypothetical protein